MDEGINNFKLILEEKKAIKLFMWLFYIIFITYDISYYFFDAKAMGRKPGILDGGFGYWFYLIIFLICPAGIYILKKGNPYVVKYLFFAGYTVIDMINSIMIYWGSSQPFRTGNLVEVFFVLFSPLFINKKYFYIVTVGMILKYVIYFVIFRDTALFVPIWLLILISAITFVLLIRFTSYVKAITVIHDDLRQKEKLAVVGQMAAAVGHEIRNPLASLKGFTQLQNERYPNTNDFYPIMIQEIDRINSIVNDLMYLGKPKMLHFEKASIEEIIAYTLSITQQQAERQKVNIDTMMKGPLPPIDCVDKKLKQVFINLIKNAIEAMPNGGNIGINIKVLEGGKMYISVQDEGCGIPEEKILNLGDPFYTTKKDGTGLGLMVTNQIVQDHNGSLNITSNVGEGTMIEVVLPIVQV